MSLSATGGTRRTPMEDVLKESCVWRTTDVNVFRIDVL